MRWIRSRCGGKKKSLLTIVMPDIAQTYPRIYPKPLSSVAWMSAVKTVRFDRTFALDMNEIRGKSPPLQNAAE